MPVIQIMKMEFGKIIYVQKPSRTSVLTIKIQYFNDYSFTLFSICTLLKFKIILRPRILKYYLEIRTKQSNSET